MGLGDPEAGKPDATRAAGDPVTGRPAAAGETTLPGNRQSGLPVQVGDRELADLIVEAAAACDAADRATGFFLSGLRRRSASTELLTARRVRRSLVEEWVLRAMERTLGEEVSRIELRWVTGSDLRVAIEKVVDAHGTTRGVPVIGEELAQALRYLTRDWRGPDTLDLTRTTAGDPGGTPHLLAIPGG